MTDWLEPTTFTITLRGKVQIMPTWKDEISHQQNLQILSMFWSMWRLEECVVPRASVSSRAKNNTNKIYKQVCYDVLVCSSLTRQPPPTKTRPERSLKFSFLSLAGTRPVHTHCIVTSYNMGISSDKPSVLNKESLSVPTDQLADQPTTQTIQQLSRLALLGCTWPIS